MRSLRACLEGDFPASLKETEIGESVASGDPEIYYYMSRHLARINGPRKAISMLDRAIDAGFQCWSALLRDPWLESVRAAPGFVELRTKAEQRRRDVHAAFIAAGGPEIVGDNRTGAARPDMLGTRTTIA